MKLQRYMRYLPMIAMTAPLMAADVEVTADITADTTWTADTTYILRKTIFVKNGATLTIEPGTLILGDNAAGPNGIIDDGGDDTFGSLVVTRSGKIHAEGTVDKPIVFTAIEERDGIGGDPELIPDPVEGDGGFWGGIILLGNAPINYYVDGTNANENDIEGFPAGSTADITYGGNDPNDSSGILKYVSIRFGGYVFNAATGSEINGLTMGGVGAGTTVENVEIISNTDDGMEIFGGTVNTKRIAVAFCQDDSFDLDEGHQGFHQFWFAIQNADSTLGDRGGEWDGGNGSTKNGTPFNNIRVYNMTLIGNGTDTTNANPGFFMTDNFAGEVHNSLVHDFSGAAITAGSLGNNGAPLPRFFNSTWGSFVGGAGVLATYATAGDGNTGIGVDPLLRGISRTNDGNLDPRPQAGSPLLGAALSAFPGDAPAGFFETVDYRGAFGEANWLRGWSYLHQKGYLKEIEVTSDITANTTWSEHETYVLRKSIFVKNGATLTIEPGALILGDNAAGPNGIIDDGGDDTFGSLIISREGTIMADGTAEKPINFTAYEEIHGIGGDLFLKPDPTEGDGGFWGGIVVLGSAPINYYVDGTNANENDIEGFPAGSTADITYGGNDPNDSSGVLRYISNRFGGYVFNAATGSEINGLTLGGVGAGTIIENVEIISNTDDGMEIFGGTVNTKRIAVAFCQDDSFDLDEGHQGFHQFWFAIQNADSTLGDRGGEWDGGNGSTKNGTPFNNIRVYNMTLIGNGTDTTNANPGFFMTDNFAGEVHNSLVHDFSGAAITAGSLGNNGAPLPRFFNSTWGSFVGGAGVLATYAAPADGNTGIGIDPLLVGISRTANQGLDPRPNLGSPLYTGGLSAFPGDAPAGFFESTNYRGAFGGSNWLNGWSWLSRHCYLTGLPDVGGGSTGGTFADSDGDGVSDDVENANTDLGFNAGVNDAASVLANVYTAAQVQANPGAFGLYDETSILDLRTVGQAIVQAGASDVLLSLPVEKSTGLSSWAPAGNLQLTIPKEGDKEFYRISVTGAE